MSSDSLISSRTNRILLVLLVVLALLSFLAMRRSLGKAMGMNTETTAKSSLSNVRPGVEIKVVEEVTAATAAIVEGNVLEKESETVYRRSSDTIKVAFDAATPLVMGKAADIHQGAVVHITAKMGNDRTMHASQIVVLNGYVTVKAK